MQYKSAQMKRAEMLYKSAMPHADILCLTEVKDTPAQADAFFPEISADVWKETGRESHPTDEKHLYPYCFVDYVRS